MRHLLSSGFRAAGVREAARPGKQGVLYTRGEGLRNAEEVEVQAPVNRI